MSLQILRDKKKKEEEDRKKARLRSKAKQKSLKEKGRRNVEKSQVV